MTRYNKAYGAGIGGGLGAAVAELIVAFGPQQLVDHETAVSIIVTAIISAIVTFLTPANTA